MDDEDKPRDAGEAAIRFGCGAVFGFAAFGGLLYTIGDGGFDLWFPLAAAFLCGALALRYGDKFWHDLADWWRH